MLDFDLKENPKIFNRLSAIQNQHRQLIVGHPVYSRTILNPYTGKLKGRQFFHTVAD